MSLRFLAIAIAGFCIVGLSSARHRGAEFREAAPNPEPPKPDATLLSPKSETDNVFWPLDRCYLWKINRLDPSVDGDLITLEIRTKHESAEFSPTFPVRLSRDKSEKTHVLETGRRDPFRFEPAIVGIQIIDLESIALNGGKNSLRLNATLNIANSTSYFRGEKGIIPGTIEATSSNGAAAKWKNGEMHLYDLIVREKDSKKERKIYSFVLVQSTYRLRRK